MKTCAVQLTCTDKRVLLFVSVYTCACIRLRAETHLCIRAFRCVCVGGWVRGRQAPGPRPSRRVMVAALQQPDHDNVIIRGVILTRESQVVCKEQRHIKVPPLPVI